MYFSALTAIAPTQHCIGAARSQTITGPYITDPDVLICPLYLTSFARNTSSSLKYAGGAIDASAFVDPETGGMYLTYKVRPLLLPSLPTTH